MRYIVPAAILLGLSIPIARAIRALPGTTGSAAGNSYTGDVGISADPVEADPTGIVEEVIHQATALLDNFGTSIMNTARKVWTPPAAAAPYLADITAAEQRYGLPPGLLARQLQQESSYKPSIIFGQVKSSAGALGIAQFMPATAAEMGIDPLNPSQAIDGAGRYMAQLYARFGDWGQALAAYNWGQGNVARKGLAKAPAETKNYFSSILSDLGLMA